jgi:hypothetical protein
VFSVSAWQRFECLVPQSFGELKGRIRRIAILAVARKLLIALWRYLETGLVPDGPIFEF